MILFWLIAGLLVAAALGVLLRPLLRGSGEAAGAREPALAMYRGQLAEIDSELAQGRLDEEAAAAFRAEITRRMLAAAEAPGAAAQAGRETTWRVGTALGIAGILPVAAFGIYLAIGMPAAITGAPDLSGRNMTEMTAAAARLRQHLDSNPGDVAGWVLYGRTMATLGRIADAMDAFRHAMTLAPGDPDLHAELGELLVIAAKGTVTPEAAAEFGKAPNDPRSRFYASEAALQRGDIAKAKVILQALLADTPKDAAYRQLIVTRLKQIASAKAPGPTAADAEAAARMTPDDRIAMIRGMVVRLAARLDAHPDDPKGWLMLARSYRVLGRDADARAALKQANADNPGNLELMKAYLDALGEAATDAHLPAELVALATRVNALDAKDPAALWFLGLDDAARGDKAGAAGYWRRLLDELPAEDGRRAAVQQRLDALR
jgi:cytochrome c-type biogenesis protein CcmH